MNARTGSANFFAIGSELAKVSDQVLDEAIERYRAQSQFGYAQVGLATAQQEKQRREAAKFTFSAGRGAPPAPAAAPRTPAPRPPADSDAEEIDQEAAVVEAMALSNRAQTLMFEAGKRGEALDVTAAVMFAKREREQRHEPEDLAENAKRLMAAAEERGQRLHVVDAVRLAREALAA